MKTTILTTLVLVSFVSIANANSAKSFNCRSIDWGDETTAVLSDDRKVLSVESVSNSHEPYAYVGDVDMNYSPKKIGSARYLVRDAGRDETRIIIDADMLNGKPGKMRIEGSTDSYWSSHFLCK